jgi:hypothetical protein
MTALTRFHLIAFGAGVLGAGAMAAASRAAGTGVMKELERLLGAFPLPPRDPRTQTVGLGLQLVNGGMLAQLYAAAFDLGVPPGWRSGLGLGLLHGAAAGAFLGAVPALHPDVPDPMPAPGAFMRRRGPAAALTFLGLHGLYGAIVGAAGREAFSASGARSGEGRPRT